MWHYGRGAVGGFTRVGGQVRGLLVAAGAAARRRPRTALLFLGLLLLTATGGGVYARALHQWHAAREAVKADRLDDADKSLGLCLWVWPRSIPVHLLAARSARLRGNFEAAEAHLNTCLKLNHGASEEIQLEFLLMRVQRGEEDAVAPELFLYVDNQSPESPLILETLARAYMHNLRYGPAFACLSRWIEVAPDSAEPFRWRAWVLERLNDHEGALRDYKRAVELDPNLVPARLRLAEIYLIRSDPVEARPHLERLRKQVPDRADVLARLGECLFLEGNRQEARRLLEAAAEQIPNDSDTFIYLAKLELQENHPVAAETWVRRALKVDPTDTEAEFVLVESLQAQGRVNDAKAALEQHKVDTAQLMRVAQVLQDQAEHPNPDPAAFSDLGALFLRSNERVGLYWLYRALEVDPENQAANKALADYYESKGEGGKAAMHRSRLKPNNQTAP
jgi:tetratricopeptide (TPR) repeat protein